VLWSLGSKDGNYSSINWVRSKINEEQHGISINNTSTNPFFVDEANGNYQLKLGSPAIKAGVALPSDIASAIGVTAGVPVNMGALKWPDIN
jgi:hypothetical protein